MQLIRMIEDELDTTSNDNDQAERGERQSGQIVKLSDFQSLAPHRAELARVSTYFGAEAEQAQREKRTRKQDKSQDGQTSKNPSC
jgi:hypothetical protein